MKDFANLETARYKTCGYGDPLYNQDGHYDDVGCRYFNNTLKFCGDIPCPLDNFEGSEDDNSEILDYQEPDPEDR